jgi:hypothetical protein
MGLCARNRSRQGLSGWRVRIEEIERRIGNAEARRRCVLREIERRNELLAHRLEISAKDVIDAEFTEVKG